MEQQNPSPSSKAAERLAEAFDRWQALQQQAQANPASVRLEDLSAAWAAVVQADEEWRNSR